MNSRSKAAVSTLSSPFTVSVVIPTKNREAHLRETLESVLEQTVQSEIILIDDGSTDNTERMVRTHFPTVTYEKNQESQGPTASRNRGAQMASGDILITLDDDCVLCRRDTIEICQRWFDSPEIAGVTLPFVNIRQDTVLRTASPDADRVYATIDYCGGMVAFRRSAFLSVDGYRTAYFMHHEEPDLAIRLLERGQLIRNGNLKLIHHLESPTRDRKKLWRLGARNTILYALFNVPLALLPLYLIATVTKTFFYAVRRGGWRPVIEGFLEAIPMVHQVWRKRNAVSWKAYIIARQLKRHGPAPMEKIRKMLAHA